MSKVFTLTALIDDIPVTLSGAVALTLNTILDEGFVTNNGAIWTSNLKPIIQNLEEHGVDIKSSAQRVRNQATGTISRTARYCLSDPDSVVIVDVSFQCRDHSDLDFKPG